MNNSHRLAPFADVIFAMDRGWWNEYGLEIKSPAELWTTNREAARVYNLNHINGEPGGGISRRPNCIKLGGNSGFQALGLALHFGAAKVVLLGYDLQLTHGRTHWHGDHLRLGNPLPIRMREWLLRFGELARETRVPIINASRASALACFPRTWLADALGLEESHEGMAEPAARSA